MVDGCSEAGVDGCSEAGVDGCSEAGVDGCSEAGVLVFAPTRGGLARLPRNPNRCGFRRGWPAAAILLVSAIAIVGTSGNPAAVASSKGSSGTFTFTGEVSGTLKVVAFLPPGQIIAGCQISPTQAGTDIIQWDNAKLKIGGKTETITNLVLQVDVEKFGRTYSLAGGSAGTPPGAVTLETNAKYSWLTDAGSVKTNSNGASGSVTGTMTAGKNHAGSATVKGSWAGCAKLAG